LHFKLELMNLEFMDKPERLIRREEVLSAES